MPVGFKNSTDGDVQIAVNAILSAARPHSFVGIDKTGNTCVLRTGGNEDCHLILRGGRQPNYDTASVAAACATLREAGLRETLMIDFSHANSSKQYLRQVEVGHEVARQVAAGQAGICGVMIESHLQEGRQDLLPGRSRADLVPGVSITDACLGWSQTRPLLHRLAQAVRSRRRAGTA